MRHLYLASASPRRRQLLAQIGAFPTLLTAPAVDESPLPGEAPMDYVSRLAQAKARVGWDALAVDQRPRAAVLAADTTVVLDGDILGKPASGAEARHMLKRLAGREHQVLTAVALATDQGLGQRLSSTLVRLLPLTGDQIEHYLATGEPFDKAGGYGIQGLAAAFVSEIHGSYSGVVGLPLAETAGLLEQAGVPFWQQEV